MAFPPIHKPARKTGTYVQFWCCVFYFTFLFFILFYWTTTHTKNSDENAFPHHSLATKLFHCFYTHAGILTRRRSRHCQATQCRGCCLWPTERRLSGWLLSRVIRFHRTSSQPSVYLWALHVQVRNCDGPEDHAWRYMYKLSKCIQNHDGPNEFLRCTLSSVWPNLWHRPSHPTYYRGLLYYMYVVRIVIHQSLNFGEACMLTARSRPVSSLLLRSSFIQIIGIGGTHGRNHSDAYYLYPVFFYQG